MPMKGGTADLQEIDRWSEGVGWLAYPEEGMQRASHAVVTESGVWAFDPVDAPGVDDLLADLGDLAGVVVCLDRHERDAAKIARRHDVPLYAPGWMTGVTADGVDIERFGRECTDAGLRSIRVRDSRWPPWQEAALTDGETLYVPEAVGTAPFFHAEDERLGVHPVLRPFPPRDELGYEQPERLLVGHGEGVFDRATETLRDALNGARRRAPSAYARALRAMLG